MKFTIPWKISTRLLAAALALALCGVPELAQAMGAPQTQNQQSSGQTQNPPAQPPANGQTSPANNPDTAMPNPAQPPLKPVETLPQAPSAQQQQNAGQASSATQQQLQQAPAGAAAAQTGPTAGGAASKPAGNAIAPAKQHQTRALLLKIGAIGGAAIAIGTVVGLSRATGSKPPGAR